MERGRTGRLFRRIMAAEARSLRWAGQGIGRVAVGAVRKIYYLRYDVIAAWLGLPARTETGQGLLLIQIDGLSYQHLGEAMRRGYAPYLASLLRSGEYQTQPWRCGLPSATPAVQAGIMYGANDDIPAFRWYDKAAGREVVCKTPILLGELQRRLSAGRRGLLEGGSSYVNLYSGGASLSLFSLAAFPGGDAGPPPLNQPGHRYFEQASGARLVRVFLFSPMRLIRMASLGAWEYALHQAQTLLVRWRGVERVETPSFGLVRLVSNVLFKELQTFALMVDAYRGVPRIMTDYNGYDEMAHHFGPASRAALRELRSIDRRIRSIDRLRRYSPYRAYDLFVFSDHGQTPSVPFRHRYGHTLHAYVHSLAGTAAPPESAEHDHFDAEYIASYLLGELRPLLHAPDASWVRWRVVGLLTRRLERALTRTEGDHQTAPLPLFVSHSSALANVYFNHRQGHAPLEEIEALYPNLLERLIAHPGVEVVVGRHADGALLIASRKGRLTVAAAGTQLAGQHPLAHLDDAEVAVAQVCELASYPHSGDLIVFSALQAPDRIINFEEQLGGHGALGGPQAQPFFMCPTAHPLDLAAVTNARQLYPILIGRYGPSLAGSTAARDAVAAR